MEEFLLRKKKILRRTPAWLAQVRIRIWQSRGLFQLRRREEQPSIEEGGRWRIPGRC